MKKNPLLFHLMTAFTAVIGLNVVALIVYIFAYTHFVGDFSATDKGASSPESVLAQTGYAAGQEAVPVSVPAISQETVQSPVEEISSTVGNTSSNGIEDDFDPAKQERFEELAQKEQAAREQEWQERQALASSVESTAPDSSQGAGPQKTTGSGQSPQTASGQESVSAAYSPQGGSEPVRNIQRDIPPVQSSATDNIPAQNRPSQASKSDTNNGSSDSQGNSGNISENSSGAYNPPENQASIPAGEEVWLSATGEKYHSKKDCGNMNPDKAQKVSLAYVINMKIERCKNCWSDQINTDPYNADNSNPIIYEAPQTTQPVGSYITAPGNRYYHNSSECKFLKDIPKENLQFHYCSPGDMELMDFFPCHCVEYQ